MRAIEPTLEDVEYLQHLIEIEGKSIYYCAKKLDQHRNVVKRWINVYGIKYDPNKKSLDPKKIRGYYLLLKCVDKVKDLYGVEPEQTHKAMLDCGFTEIDGKYFHVSEIERRKNAKARRELKLKEIEERKNDVPKYYTQRTIDKDSIALRLSRGVSAAGYQ